MSECKNVSCTCTSINCSKHGKCCECIAHHRKHNEVPGCYFNSSDEKEYNRSIEFYLKSSSSK